MFINFLAYPGERKTPVATSAVKSVHWAPADKMYQVNITKQLVNADPQEIITNDRAEIKKAEGVRQARILNAEGEAEAIRLVNEAAGRRYLVGNSQLLKRLETAQLALQNNSKIIVPANQQLVNVIVDLAGIATRP